jgi:hypothetical protein
MGSVEPKIMESIERAVRELAQMDYPKVWIGEEGITADELLAKQLANEDERREAWEGMNPDERRKVWDEEIPEREKEGLHEPPRRWSDLPEGVREELKTPLEVEPGEFVSIEGTEGGIQMPEVGLNWLDGRWVLLHMPDLMPVDVSPGLGDLLEEVGCIEAAKRDGVVVKTACVVKFTSEDALTESDGAFIASAPFAPGGEALVVVFEGYERRFVPLDDLAPEDVDEDLLETLEFHVSDSIDPYVIEDSERARRALRERLGEE